VEEGQRQGRLAKDVDPELIAWLIAGWAWTGDVASSMGVNGIWYDRVSPRLIDFILGGLAENGTAAGTSSPALEEAELDGLPDGAVFTIERRQHPKSLQA
jgi:hypothetical protein